MLHYLNDSVLLFIWGGVIPTAIIWSFKKSRSAKGLGNSSTIIAMVIIAAVFWVTGWRMGSTSLDGNQLSKPTTATTSTAPVDYKKTESGPERASFSQADPPSKPTLNTVHDYPDWGDEQNFIAVSDGTKRLRNAISVSDGARRRITVFIRNDAAGSDSVALNTRLKIYVPNKINTGSEPITAVLTSDNTTHKKIWDSVTFSNLTKGAMFLKVDLGTAEFIVNGKKRDDFSTRGVFNSSGLGELTGCTAQDGKVFGDNNCTIRFEFDVIVSQVGTSAATSAKLKYSNYAFNQNVQALPGDTLTILVDFHNPYRINLNNTEVHFNTLPEWARPVSNSMTTRRYTISEGRRNYENWEEIESDFAKNGFFRFHNFQQNQGIQFQFDIKIADDAARQSDPINLVVCNIKPNKNTQFSGTTPASITLLL